MANREEAENEEYERLKNSKFKQQKLPGWRPVPTITSTTIIFFCFGAVFIVLGIIILVFSNQIEEVSYRYDEECKNQKEKDKNKPCTITMHIKNKMEPKIMIYYQLNGFYQNHRRYVKSKSDEQLHGKEFTVEEMKDSQDCDPAITNEDMGKIYSCLGDKEENKLNPKGLAIPCGLIAKSFFNDVFKKWELEDGTKLEPNEKDIAWKADKELKYKNTKDLNKQWIDMTNEHFIVWMRPAGLPNFRKLWGRIEKTIEANSNVIVEIEDNFDVSTFNGKKYLILSTVNAFGGKNSFLGISYIVLGGISIILAVVFIIGYNVHSKKNK